MELAPEYATVPPPWLNEGTFRSTIRKLSVLVPSGTLVIVKAGDLPPHRSDCVQTHETFREAIFGASLSVWQPPKTAVIAITKAASFALNVIVFFPPKK